MKTNKRFLHNVLALVGLAFMIPTGALAQQSKMTRTELQKHDISVPGREVIQVRIDFEPHNTFAKHSHPGEEVIYVLEGLLEYEVEGMPSVILKPGEVLFIPAGAIHSAKNIGDTKGVELATYIVEKGKPVLTLKP